MIISNQSVCKEVELRGKELTWDLSCVSIMCSYLLVKHTGPGLALRVHCTCTETTWVCVQHIYTHRVYDVYLRVSAKRSALCCICQWSAVQKRSSPVTGRTHQDPYRDENHLRNRWTSFRGSSSLLTGNDPRTGRILKLIHYLGWERVFEHDDRPWKWSKLILNQSKYI